MDIVSYHTRLNKDRHNILVKEKSVSYDEEVNFDMLNDFIIIGNNRYFSFHEQNMIE